jgi:hypothetical protein
MSRLRLIVAAKSDAETARRLFLTTWDREECRVLGALLAHNSFAKALNAVHRVCEKTHKGIESQVLQCNHVRADLLMGYHRGHNGFRR